MATATSWDGYGNKLGWLDGNGNIFYHVAVAMSDSNRQLRTIDVEPDEHMLIKPGELIDIVELSPLTLQDRRIYNLLILNAWDSITEAKEHRIHKRDLRGSHNVNDRVGESLLRLMGAVAQLRIERDTIRAMGRDLSPSRGASSCWPGRRNPRAAMASYFTVFRRRCAASYARARNMRGCKSK
jgi:hypothetical protein